MIKGSWRERIANGIRIALIAERGFWKEGSHWA